MGDREESATTASTTTTATVESIVLAAIAGDDWPPVGPLPTALRKRRRCDDGHTMGLTPETLAYWGLKPEPSSSSRACKTIRSLLGAVRPYDLLVELERFDVTRGAKCYFFSVTVEGREAMRVAAAAAATTPIVDKGVDVNEIVHAAAGIVVGDVDDPFTVNVGRHTWVGEWLELPGARGSLGNFGGQLLQRKQYGSHSRCVESGLDAGDRRRCTWSATEGDDDGISFELNSGGGPRCLHHLVAADVLQVPRAPGKEGNALLTLRHRVVEHKQSGREIIDEYLGTRDASAEWAAEPLSPTGMLAPSFWLVDCLKADIFAGLDACFWMEGTTNGDEGAFPAGLLNHQLVHDPSSVISIPSSASADFVVETIPTGETYRTKMPVGLFVTTYRLPFRVSDEGVEAIRCYPKQFEDDVRMLDRSLVMDRSYGANRRDDAERNYLAAELKRLQIWTAPQKTLSLDGTPPLEYLNNNRDLDCVSAAPWDRSSVESSWLLDRLPRFSRAIAIKWALPGVSNTVTTDDSKVDWDVLEAFARGHPKFKDDIEESDNPHAFVRKHLARIGNAWNLQRQRRTVGECPNFDPGTPVLPPEHRGGKTLPNHALIGMEDFHGLRSRLWPESMAEAAAAGPPSRTELGLDQRLSELTQRIRADVDHSLLVNAVLRRYYGDSIGWTPAYEQQVRDVFGRVLGPRMVVYEKTRGDGLNTFVDTPPHATQCLRHHIDPELRLKLVALCRNAIGDNPKPNDLFRRFGLLSKPEAVVVYRMMALVLQKLQSPELHGRTDLYCLLRAAGDRVDPPMSSRPPGSRVVVEWQKSGIRPTSKVGIDGIDAIVRRALLLKLRHLSGEPGTSIVHHGHCFVLEGSFCDRL